MSICTRNFSAEAALIAGLPPGGGHIFRNSSYRPQLILTEMYSFLCCLVLQTARRQFTFENDGGI